MGNREHQHRNYWEGDSAIIHLQYNNGNLVQDNTDKTSLPYHLYYIIYASKLKLCFQLLHQELQQPLLELH